MRQATTTVFLLLTAAMAGLIGGCSGDDPTEPTPSAVAPTAAFSSNPTSGEAPLTVAFTDESSDSPTAWAWTFGDGATSTQQNPSHVYHAAGTFTVSLMATNAEGSDTESKTNHITATAVAGPVPVLDEILPLGAGVGMTITLKGQNFGDGSKRASTVMFGSVPAGSFPAWYDDEIEVVVPTLDPPSVEQVEVKVVIDGRESNTITFYREYENTIRLTNNSYTDWQPCWAGNSIIYFASFAGGNFNIYYMDADGGPATQRTFFAEGQTDMPAVSPTTLYYRSNHDGQWDIYSSSGSGMEGRITNTPEKDFEVVVAANVAPFRIALSRAEEHSGGTIWNIYGLGNSGLVQISDNAADFHPTFSPNGSQVAYMYKWGDFSNGQIMVVPVLGGDSTLISDPDQHCAYPTWNPAFDTIAYTRGGGNVFMCNPDGTDEVQLTFTNLNIVYPIWSPDGRRLAYAAFYQGSYELYVVDVSDILTAR